MSPAQLKREIAGSFDLVRDRSTEDEIYIVCPVPGCADKSGNRSINTRTLYTHCWRCHEPQPHHVRSLFRLVGLDYNDDHVLEIDEVERMLAGETKKAITPVQEVPLPAAFEPLSENRKSCYWRFCRDMAERKHLAIEDLEEAKAGFAREGLWEPYCIFPVYEGPRLVYYQGRTYTDDGFKTTKRFPSKKEIPYGMSYWVYNLDAMADSKVRLVLVVESILNVLSLRRALREVGSPYDQEIVPICIFTHRISRPQRFKLGRYKHVREFCILFDSDSSNLAVETAVALNASMLPTMFAEMPHGVNADGTPRLTNDANDDVLAALQAVDARRVPTPQDVLEAKASSLYQNYASKGQGQGAVAHLGF